VLLALWVWKVVWGGSKRVYNIGYQGKESGFWTLLTWVRVHQQLSHKGVVSKGTVHWGGVELLDWLAPFPKIAAISSTCFYVLIWRKRCSLGVALHFFVEHTYTTMVLMCSFVQLKMANFGLRDLCLEKTYLNQSIHIYICTSSQELFAFGSSSIYDFNQYARLTITRFSKAWYGPQIKCTELTHQDGLLVYLQVLPSQNGFFQCWAVHWFLIFFLFLFITSLILCAWKFSKIKETQFWVF